MKVIAAFVLLLGCFLAIRWLARLYCWFLEDFDRTTKSTRKWPLNTLWLLAIFILVPTTRADTTQTWDVTANCSQPACFDPANLSAVLTTTLESGTFYDPVHDTYFTGSEPVITSFSGTFDDAPITDLGGWLLNGNPYGGMWFTAGGIGYALFWDGIAFIQNSTLQVEFVNWSAVDPVGVPEPRTILLLTVPLLLGLMKWAQMSLRKYSAR